MCWMITANVALTTDKLDQSVSSELPGNPPLWIARRDASSYQYDLYVNDARVIRGDIKAMSSRQDEQVRIPSSSTGRASTTSKLNEKKKGERQRHNSFYLLIICVTVRRPLRLRCVQHTKWPFPFPSTSVEAIFKWYIFSFLVCVPFISFSRSGIGFVETSRVTNKQTNNILYVCVCVRRIYIDNHIFSCNEK